MVAFVCLVLTLTAGTSHAAVTAEAHALAAFLTDLDPPYTEPDDWDEELAALTPARQAVIARELTELITPERMQRLQTAVDELAAGIVRRERGLEHEFMAEAARLERTGGVDDATSLLVAQGQAVRDLGLPSVAWVLRPENYAYRGRWKVKVDQILRSEAGTARLSPARLATWKAHWQTRLNHEMVGLVQGQLNQALKFGCWGYAELSPVLMSAAGEIVEMTSELLDGAQLMFRPDWPGGQAVWAIETSSGDQLAIYTTNGLPFDLDAGTHDASGFVNAEQLEAYVGRFVAGEYLDDITRLSQFIQAIPPRPTRAEFNAYADEELRRAKMQRLTVTEVRSHLLGIASRPRDQIPLRELLAVVRVATVLEAGQENFWEERHVAAEDAGRPQFSFWHLPPPPIRSRGGQPRGTQSAANAPREKPFKDGRNVFDTQDVYRVRGATDADVFQLRPLTAPSDDWAEARPSGREPVTELHPLEDEEVTSAYLPVPTPLGREITELEVRHADDRLQPGLEYHLLRHLPSGAYGVYFTDRNVTAARLTVKFARDRDHAVLEDVPLRKNRSPHLARMLREIGETALSAALERAPVTSARALAHRIHEYTRYSFAEDLNVTPPQGPLAFIAPFLDEEGRLCVQCDHAAYLLMRLLNESLPPGYVARVRSGLLRRGTTLIRPAHAAADVYHGGRPVLRLDPTPAEPDPRAPTADVVRARQRRAAERETARELGRAQARLLAIYRDVPRLPKHAPLLRMYRLISYVRAALEDDAADRTALAAHVETETAAALAEHELWTGIEGGRRADRWIAPLHASTLDVAHGLAERLRVACEGALGEG